jgi:hypothetical protein
MLFCGAPCFFCEAPAESGLKFARGRFGRGFSFFTKNAFCFLLFRQKLLSGGKGLAFLAVWR